MLLQGKPFRGAVRRIFVRTIQGWLRERAGGSESRSGAST